MVRIILNKVEHIDLDVREGVWSLESTIERDEPEAEDFSPEYNAAIDGLESLVLALAAAGVNMADGAMPVAITTAVESIVNHFT